MSTFMTDADMAQREKIVKSMKKNFADFRKRYGSRAKEVMYATATKMANEDVQTENYVHVRTHDNTHDDYISSGVKAHGGTTHAHTDKGVVFKFDSKDDANKFKQHINKNKKIYADEVNEEAPATPPKPQPAKKVTKTKPATPPKPMKAIKVAAPKPKSMQKEEHDLQGSSIKNIPYDELDMEDVAHAASSKVAEDDGPHVSKLSDVDSPNFTTVLDPVAAVNAQSKLGNVDSKQSLAKRMTGKPFKSLRKRTSYGVEDLTGAVSGVAIGEAVKTEADKGEYDYEGDMAKSQLRSILHNAKLMHDMLEDTTNLPEWVQSKITLAEDYIVTASQYMQSKMNEETETPKMKYKKLRSKERFDARTKEVDQNYPYRSDN